MQELLIHLISLGLIAGHGQYAGFVGVETADIFLSFLRRTFWRLNHPVNGCLNGIYPLCSPVEMACTDISIKNIVRYTCP